ncbi:NAD(P)-binding protein [Aureobasidium sp. EXF-12298]|nr:NAD(P)-binding protein [Aureobasidium sp. EXF-12298]KAI4763452.1 NAD(P)-binding protein [Aureobasidium sp. EXF-12344]KAI4780551.1 NAD(P)-binding protein [Aureobasidium sp. EXF-3400]
MALSAGSTLPEVSETYDAIAPAKYAGKLQDKVVIVTGSSSGIGRSISKAFAAAGASVAVIARREKDLLTLVDEIKSTNGKAIPVVADVAAKGAAQKLVAQVEKELGPVDILVNNAGMTRMGPLDGEDEDLDIWWRVHEVNVRAPVSLVRAVLPSMLKRNTGVLISTGSAVATMTLPVMTAYTSSKAAISKFHESLIEELKDTDIVSFSVHPGYVKTELGAAENAVNKAQSEHPAMQGFLKMLSSGQMKQQKPELAADTMVALAADPRYKVLTGRHINATQELPPVAEEAEKEGMGRLGKDRLYLITVPTL